MSELKLKPCPFCGRKPIIEHWSSDEMARSSMLFFDCPYGTPCVGCSKGKEFNNNCTDCTKHWLESEVEE